MMSFNYTGSHFSGASQASSSNFHASPTTQDFDDVDDEADFIVVNEIPPSQNLLPEHHAEPIPRHPHLGYPLAVRRLCKMVKANAQAIQLAGGRDVDRKGMAVVVASPDNSRPKQRFVTLADGKLKVYKVNPAAEASLTAEGEFVPEDEDLVKEGAYYLQRLKCIKYDLLSSPQFTCVFVRPKDAGAGAARRPGNAMKQTLSRMKKTMSFNSSMSMASSSHGTVREVERLPISSTMGRIKRNFSRNGKKKNNSVSSNFLKFSQSNNDEQSSTGKKSGTLFRARYKKNPKFTGKSAKQNRGASTNIETCKTADEEEEEESPSRSRSTLTRFRSRKELPVRRNVNIGKITTISSNSLASSVNSSWNGGGDRSRMLSTVGTTISSNSVTLLDERGNAVEVEDEEVELRFRDTEECQSWLKSLLVEVGNVAKVFQAYVELLERKPDSASNDNSRELMLRYAVDLLTLAKGVRNYEVWKTRESLAQLLDKKGDLEEAKIWYEMSQNLRNGTDNKIYAIRTESRDTKLSYASHKTVKIVEMRKENLAQNRRRKPKTRDEAFDALVEFLEMYSSSISGVSSAEEKADHLFKSLCELTEVAKRVEAEFGRVPEGFEAYLQESALSPLETLQREAEEMAN